MIKYSLLILTFLSVQFSFAQDLSFRSLNALPIVNNPAFTGTNASPRLNYGIVLKNLGFASNHIQNYASYDQRVDALRGGVGLEIMHSKVLKYENYQAGIRLSYSYQQNIAEKLCLSFGARLEYEHLKLNVNDFFDLNDPSPIRTSNHLNYALGGLLYGEKFFLGAVYTTFIYESFSGEVDRVGSISSSIGYNWTPFKNKTLSFTPVARHYYVDGFHQINFQASFNTKRISFGGGYARGSYISFFAGYQFDKFSIKTVRGLTDSPLTSAGSGSQELIFQYNFNKNTSGRSFNMNLF